jgi:hypothetical protein
MSAVVVVQQQGAGNASIVAARIHPAIGVARLGNSPDGFFIGPETPGQVPEPEGGRKDAEGRIKRQAARFRLYGLDGAGNVVRELTAGDAQITWTVHLANKKAAWYAYDFALDIPEAQPCKRRNAAVTLQDRASLVIDPGARAISGANSQAGFGGGTFMGVPVSLGEIRTDDQGRLLVFGGLGTSGTPLADNPAQTYGNNDGWYDDIGDGPVSAEVVLDGRAIPVTPSWVITAQPDYAPTVQSIVTLYDIVFEVATQLGLPEPPQVSFTEHIAPILQRFSAAQWVNEGFSLQFGFGMPEDFGSPAYLAQLADDSAAQRALRLGIFQRFRHPDYATVEQQAWPPVYGDGWQLNPPFGPRQWLALTPLLYRRLERWAQGDFRSDWTPDGPPTAGALDDLPLPDRPVALDRAALEACMGGPFHPGGEATWPFRQRLLYEGPFRIKEQPAGTAQQDYGDTLTPAVALAPGGPLDGSGPGDVTRWMAVPWQTDVSSCGSGYNPDIGKYLPTFWPARVPNHVLTEASYAQVMDGTLSEQQRVTYFHQRDDWLRGFGPDYQIKINQFVQDWGKVGIIVRKDGPTGDPALPATLYVEIGNEFQTHPDQMEQRVNPRQNA